MIEYLEVYLDKIWTYTGFHWVFWASLFLLFFVCKDRRRILVVLYPIIAFLVLFNPFFYSVFYKAIGSGFHYLRLYGFVPFLVVIAYVFTLLVQQQKGYFRIVVIALIVANIIAYGNSVYYEKNATGVESRFVYAENRLKIPGGVQQVCDEIQMKSSDYLLVVSPKDFAYFGPQYTSHLNFYYSKWNFDGLNGQQVAKERQELTRFLASTTPDKEKFVEYLTQWQTDGVDVIVWTASLGEDYRALLSEYGYQFDNELGGYDVFIHQ